MIESVQMKENGFFLFYERLHSMSDKKYEFVESVVWVRQKDGCEIDNLRRIRALRDIPCHGVKAGDLGGYIKDEKNLSHEGDAWIGGEAYVYGDARIEGGLVHENAIVSGYSISRGEIGGDSILCGQSFVEEGCRLAGKVTVENSSIMNGSQLDGEISIMHESIVSGTNISGNVSLRETVILKECTVEGNVSLRGRISASHTVFDGRGREQNNPLKIAGPAKFKHGYIFCENHWFSVSNFFDDSGKNFSVSDEGEPIIIFRGEDGELVVNDGKRLFGLDVFLKNGPLDTRRRVFEGMARAFSSDWFLNNQIIENNGPLALPTASDRKD